MKKVSIMALILVLTLSLTACFGGDTELYKAFNKMQDIRRFESETELSFNLSGEGFTEEEEMVLEQLAFMLNTTQVKFYNKTIQNEDQTVAKMESKMEMVLGGMPIILNLWQDVDVSGDEFKTVQVFELPQILGLMMPELASKQYIVNDLDEIMTMAEDEIDMQAIMKLSKELQPKMMEFIKEIEKEFKPEIDMVEKKESKEIDGEKLTIYEIKLNDHTLKELVKYTVDYILENESFKEFMTDYINTVVEVVLDQQALTKEETAEVTEDLAEFTEEMEELLPELQEKFHEFMEKFKDVEILGEDGIKVELGINGEGYIVHEEGTIDLRLDLASIGKAMGEESPEAKVLNLGTNYKSKVYNINNEDIEVTMPELTEENSISYMKLIEMFEEPNMPAPMILP